MGSIASLGSEYVLGLRARNCRTGDILDEEQAQAARKEDVLNALSQIASKFRTRVGESLAMVQKHDTPLEEATTPSLEALKAYSSAMKVDFSTGSAAAVPLFKRAIEIDPKFAMAHAFLGRVYGDIGESDLSAESIRQAWQLRDRVTDAEKFFITANYDLQVTGNLEKAQATFELWAQTYPREIHAPGLLSGQIYPFFGKHEKAVEEAKIAIGIDPNFPFPYVDLATAYQFLNRLDEAEATFQRASDRKLLVIELLGQRYDLAFLRGDKAEMARMVALCQGEPGTEASIAGHEALVLAYSGHLQEAGRMSGRAAALAQRAGQREGAALLEAGATLRDAFFGNATAAREAAKETLKLSKDRDVEYGAALALALSGDATAAQILANDLEKRFPEDSSVRICYLPELHALLALNHGEPAKAIEALQSAGPYELGVPLSWFNGSLAPSILSMCVARPICWPINTPRPPRNSRKFSIIAGSWVPTPSAHWRICKSAERSLCREIRPGPRPLTWISSLSGKMPIRTYRSFKKPRRNTRGYDRPNGCQCGRDRRSGCGRDRSRCRRNRPDYALDRRS